jgi:hypothetical protein
MRSLFTDCIHQFCWHQLDQRLPELGIVSYGIGVTTMEEVFLRVAEEGAIAAAERDNRTSCCPPPDSHVCTVAHTRMVSCAQVLRVQRRLPMVPWQDRPPARALRKSM